MAGAVDFWTLAMAVFLVDGGTLRDGGRMAELADLIARRDALGKARIALGQTYGLLCSDIATVNDQTKHHMPTMELRRLQQTRERLRMQIEVERTKILEVKNELRKIEDELHVLRQHPNKIHNKSERLQAEINAFRVLIRQAEGIFHREMSKGFMFSEADRTVIDRVSRVANGEAAGG